MREIFIRTNDLNWLDYLQVCVDSKNTQYNRTTKHTPNTIWNPDSFYTNVKNKTRELPPSLATGVSPEDVRIQARENIKAKAKKQIERTHINELNIGDHVRVKMSSLYSELRREVKQGNKKLINVSYSPEIYRVFKIIKEDHPTYERKRYTLKKLDGSPLLTESKVNEMRKTHRYRRLFASDLLKVDKQTKNVGYDNDRAVQLNKVEIEREVIEKPVIEKDNKIIEQQQPQEIRRSSREI